MGKIVCIPDTHFPFANKKSLNKMYAYLREWGNDISHVVHLGDLKDCLSNSSFPKDLNIFTPEEEFLRARADAEEMWLTIQDICKKARCYQLMGNHEARWKKSIVKRLPEMLHLFNIKKAMDFPNVKTIYDEREVLVIKDIIFTHGFSITPMYHVNYFKQSVVFGHTHRPHVMFLPVKGKIYFELNCGYLADPESPGLAYTPIKKYTTWTNSFGVIDEKGNPIVIPL